jgi:hypothetical protein
MKIKRKGQKRVGIKEEWVGMGGKKTNLKVKCKDEEETSKIIRQKPLRKNTKRK